MLSNKHIAGNWNKWGGVGKVEAMYVSMSYFFAFFHILRKYLSKSIMNNVDLTA